MSLKNIFTTTVLQYMVRPVTNFHRDRAGTSLKLPGPGFAEDYQDRDPGRSLVTELYDDFVLFLYKFNL